MSRLRKAVLAALDEGRPERAWDLAAEVWASAPMRDRVEARRLLHSLGPRVPPAAWSTERSRVARGVGVEQPRAVDRIGAVAFPAVDPQGEGRFIEARARRITGRGDQLPEGLDPETLDALYAALDGVRATLDEPGARFSIELDPIPGWRGGSAGLAVALAALSAARALPLSPLVAATGRVDPIGRVGGVGLIAEKLRLRQAARPHARMLVPMEDDPNYPPAIPVGSLREAMGALELGDLESVAARVRRVRDLDAEGDWLEAARHAEPLVQDPDLTDDERLDTLVVLLAAANHLADVPSQERWTSCLSAHAVLLDADDGVEGLARAIGSRAVHHIDALDPIGAREVLALAESRRWRASSRVHLDGPAALLCTLTGDHVRALRTRQTSLDRASVDQRGRCLADLADALLRMDRPVEALERVEQGLELVSTGRRRSGYQDASARYLHLHRARALAALDRQEEALVALDRPSRAPGLDPWLRAALLAAEIREAPGAVGNAQRVLPSWAMSSPLVGALLDRSLARLGDPEAARRLLALPPFQGLDLDEAARRLPY